MKKQIITPLIVAFGLATISQPVFAMKRGYPQPSDSISVMARTFATAMGWIWARYSDSLSRPTTFVSAQGTHFVVPAEGLDAFAQLSTTIALLLLRGGRG